VRRAHWNARLMDESQELRDEVLKRHSFDHIPLGRRVKVFKVEKDEQVVNEIKDRVELCREYFNTLYNFL